MKPKYLVGYKGDEIENMAECNSISEARELVKRIKKEAKLDSIIYKLVPVEEKKIKR